VAKKAKVSKKKVVKKNIARGIVHIYSSFNNTIITITDLHGNTISWASSGVGGAFKGAKKSTPFAAQVASETAAKQAMEHGVVEVHVRIKGPGSGRETAIRALGVVGIRVLSIVDVTPIPHNGCRPPKQRRG
jgi:small subunit ribosomal protein S11